jgi:tRNA pseudouridine55 synthase
MDGILALDKPAGWTSHDVVAKVRQLTRVKRAGHTGTLDPMATGVLIVCLGQATRVVEYLIGHDKRYRATIRLGIETDTYDAQGRAVAERPVAVSQAALREALAAFVGEIDQVPPMHSAIKQAGQKLYRLARQGIAVERAPRRVTVHSIDLLGFEPPFVALDVHCSAGTYIRSLAHDLGERLGCGAHLSALTRTAAGAFTLQQAVTLETLEKAAADGAWAALLLPIDAGLTELPALSLNDDEAARVRHGRVLPARLVEGDLIRVYDSAGQLVGLMRRDAARGELRPEKILVLV